MNISGVNALHRGIEVDFLSKPIKNLEITGMISYGDWKWDNNGRGLLFTSQGMGWNAAANGGRGEEVPVGDPNQTKTNVILKGIHVGNSAQTTAAIGVKYEVLKGFNLGIDGNYYGRNYANYSLTPTSYADFNPGQPWEIPDAYVFDVNMSYRFKMGGFDASIIGNMQNVFNTEYISDATDGKDHDWKTASVFYGFGRTFSTTLKIKF